jgi:hypothetical protein
VVANCAWGTIPDHKVVCYELSYTGWLLLVIGGGGGHIAH